MKHLIIAEHYNKCFQKYGDSHMGVDWPNKEDALKRYDIMLDLISVDKEVSLLDFGCGTAALQEHIIKREIKNIKYSGLDINQSFYQFCKNKFPNNNFYHLDILQNDNIPIFDYIICNGTFTEKRELNQEEMMEIFTNILKILWSKCESGIAFNLMSKIVDWERSDLFHVSLDELGIFLKKNLSRNFIIRNDYGLYEYTTYVYK